MNRQQRRRAARLGIDPNADKHRVKDVALNITGLDALVSQLRDDRWYRLQVYFNRSGAVHFSEQINPITGLPPR
jgi:hypothetical protein